MHGNINRILNIIIPAAVVLLFSIKSALSYWEKVENLPSGYNSGDYYLDVYFLESDPAYGWVCGFGGKVLRTTDGGRTWKGVRIPNVNQLESVDFPTKDVGYVSGDTKIFKSVNGGASWTDVSPRTSFSYSLWGNFFLSANEGLVIGGGCQSYQLFFRTTNGGVSWSLSIDSIPDSGLSDLLIYPDGKGFASSSGIVWITSDRGRTWDVLCSSGNKDWQEEITNSGNTILMPYSFGCGGGEGGGGIGGARASGDLGKTWKDTRLRHEMYGSFLMDSLRGWICGKKQSVYYTSDGGLSWELKNCGIEPSDSLDDLWFINDTTGWVVGTSIYRYMPDRKSTLELALEGNTTFCAGDSVNISAIQEFKHYKWSTGETTRFISPKTSGNYFVLAWNNECDSAASDTINVKVNSPPLLEIKASGNTRICEGDSLILYIEPGYADVLWSDGSTGDSIVVKTQGNYSVGVVDSNGCQGSSLIDVAVLPLPQPKIENTGRTSPCLGFETELQADTDYSYYTWLRNDSIYQSGSGLRRIKVDKAGTYSLIAVNSDNCSNISNEVIINFVEDSNRISSDFENGSLIFTIDTTALTQMNCGLLNIHNKSSQPFIIDDLYLYRNIEFSIPQSQFPITIAPQSDYGIKICFSPYRTGISDDTLLIPDNCTDHLLPVKAAGKGNIYYSTSKCDIPIRIISFKMNYKKYINISLPYPNPADKEIRLSYTKYSEDGDFSGDSYKILDIWAREENIGIRREITDSYYDNGYIENGEIIIGLEKVCEGFIFLNASLDGNSQIFPVIVKKE